MSRNPQGRFQFSPSEPWKRIALACVCFGIAGHVPASQFTPGNILASQGRFTLTPFRITEYTRQGTAVQWFDVPGVAGQSSSDYNRGMVVDHKGRLHVFNGTFNPHLSTLDPVTGQWTVNSVPGLSVINNGTYGKIAAFGDYVFVPDHETANGIPHGIVRINVTNGQWTRFATPGHPNDCTIDLNVGPEGLLYSLAGGGSPSGRFVQVFDPLTLELVRTIDLAHIAWGPGGSVRDCVVNLDGGFWLNQLNGDAFRLSPSGLLLSTHSQPASDPMLDFDIDEDGKLMRSCNDGRIYLFDSNFLSPQFFDSTGGQNSSQTFSTFVRGPGTRLAPRSHQVLRGAQTGGDSYSAWSSDDVWLQVRAGFTLSPTEAPIQVTAETTSPIVDPQEIVFQFEASVNTPGLTQILEAFNFVTGQWETVDTWVANVSDTLSEVVIDVDADRFVNPSTQNMRLKLSFKRSGLTLLWPWSANIDKIQWSVTG